MKSLLFEENVMFMEEKQAHEASCSAVGEQTCVCVYVCVLHCVDYASSSRAALN